MEQNVIAELVFENGRFARLSEETSKMMIDGIKQNKVSGSSLITDGQTTYNMDKVLKINWIRL